jgi:hypothetical protein
MVTVKIHLNGVISTKGECYCTINLKDFYLNTPMVCPELMRMKLAELPKDFARIYKLHSLVNANGFVTIKIQKRNVWPPSSRHPCARAPPKTP